MSWYRRSNAPGLKGGRRRSSASYGITAGRRCSIPSVSVRVRSSSKGHIGRDFEDDDIEVVFPPLEELPCILGYESVTFEPCTIPPPEESALNDSIGEEAGDLKPFSEVPSLTESEIRRVLIDYADTRCIFDRYAAMEMVFTSIECKAGYKYTLESFMENRQVAWSFEPYTGGPLDEVDASNPAPSVWSIECANPKPFQMNTQIVDVPRTDVLRTCHVCSGVGSKRCTACSAAGWERCSLCLGDGYKISIQGHRERCFRCIGTGRKKCWKCGGETIAVCRVCEGTGQIRCFIAVTISWSNQLDTDMLEPPDALEISERLEFVKGHLIFQDEKTVIPSVSFPFKDLQNIASALLEKHTNLFLNEKLLLQRHAVWSIPVIYLTYEWKNKQKSLLIYGSRNDVYAPNFPESICCCCTIS